MRIHADSESDSLNRDLNAKAFTLGSDIFLSAQAASKEEHGGDALLAHELSHVIQQPRAEPGGPLSVDAVDAPGEQEATAVPHALGSAKVQSQPLTAGPARVQRESATKGGKESEVGGLKTRLDTLEQADRDRKKQDEIRDKKVASLALDRLWRAKFGERMASYKQAVWRITAGIDMAKQGFEQAQIAQSQTDQLATRLFGLGAAVLFAGTFEWLAGAALKGLGGSATKISNTVGKVEAKAESALPPAANIVSLPSLPQSTLKWNTGSIIETAENPMNALVGGYMTNIREHRSSRKLPKPSDVT